MDGKEDRQKQNGEEHAEPERDGEQAVNTVDANRKQDQRDNHNHERNEFPERGEQANGNL